MAAASANPHLAAILEASATRFPERTAVVSPDGSSVTYRQLNDQADRIAAFLVRRGVQPGDRVGILIPKSKESVIAIFGILKARAAYVPADYTAPAARLRSIFADCQLRAIFIYSGVLNVLTEASPEARPETIVALGCTAADARARGLDGAMDWETVLAEKGSVDTSASRSLDDLAFILYTSGSTGIPKGVMLSQRNATSLTAWASSVYQPTEDDRFSNHPPFHFDMSVQDLYPALQHGAALFIVSEDLGKDPRKLALFISENRLTIWYSTPSILTLLAEYGNLRKLSLDSLRIVGFAGESFPVKHLRKLVDLLPHPAYYNFYGPTETNVCTFARVPTPVPPDRTEPFPIGSACYHCTPLVLDANRNALTPGEEGLLYISGPSVSLGYWNRPQENAAAFLERDGRRWYNTGDVVREDPTEGFIYLGRRDRMVKRRGFRIELDDVQSGLYRHKGLREVAVIAVPDADSGVKIVAYLSAHAPDNKPSIIELKTFCNQELPAYMSPDVFIFLDALPRTSTDKVNFPALQAAFLEGK